MMRKKVVFTRRDPARASFFPPQDTLRIPFLMWDLEIQPYSLCDAVCVVKPLNTIVDIDTPKRDVQLEARSPRHLLASVSDLLPSPAAFAARAKRQPSSRRRCFAAAPAFPPRSSPSRDSRPTCCGSGPSPDSLVACRSDASWHLHSASPSVPRLAPHARHLVACAPARTAELERAVQHQRVLRQSSKPRRTTCPPQCSSSSRFHDISNRPELVR
jgi:hypothetical protein